MVNAEATAAPPSDIVKTPGKTGTGDKSPQQYTGNICHDGDKDMEDVALDSPTDEAANDSPAAVIDEDQVFCMSGKGTLLYMASEVLSSSRCYKYVDFGLICLHMRICASLYFLVFPIVKISNFSCIY